MEISIQETKNKIMNCNQILVRFLFLLSSSFFLMTWLSNGITDATKNEKLIDEKYEYSKVPLPLPIFLNDISTVFKIPLSFMRFDIYVYNDVISSKLNINLAGQYKHNILYGKQVRIANNINYYNLPSLNFERSFESINGATTIGTGSYGAFLKPTPLTFFIMWIFINIPIVYAFLAVFAACKKFVLFGYPFIDPK